MRILELTPVVYVELTIAVVAVLLCSPHGTHLVCVERGKVMSIKIKRRRIKPCT